MDLQNITESSSGSILYNPDFIAIIGGVICFWGGIALLGLLFMLVLMAKNYLVNNIYKKKFDE